VRYEGAVKRILVIGAVLSVAFGFGLTAWAGGGGSGDDGTSSAGTPRSSDEDAPEASESEGVHGGPIERYHVPGSCDLVSTDGLPGNWTHGDYVSAVAGLGDATLVVEAAHSGCGKPMQAVGHGQGPPAHALEHAIGPPAHALDHAAASGPAAAGSATDEPTGS
jgi:hypothetical protein